MAVDSIAKIIPAVQSAILTSHNVSKIKKGGISTKDILILGLTNIVGTKLIQATAGITGGL